MSYATAAPSVGADHASVNTVREVIEHAIAVDGLKRGLFRAADMLGVTERWLRSLRFGEPARVSAATYLRAVEARRRLREERRTLLLAELRAIDAAEDAEWQATINNTKARIVALEGQTREEDRHSNRQMAAGRVDTEGREGGQEGRELGGDAVPLARVVTR